MTSHRPTIRVEDGNASQSDDEEFDNLLFVTPPQSPSPNPDQEHSPFLTGDRAAASAIPAGPEHVNNVANPSTEQGKVVAKAGSSSTTERPASEFQRHMYVAAGKKLPSFPTSELLDVADGNDLVSSDQSLPSSPTPTESALFSNPSPFVGLTGSKTPTTKQRNKHKLSLDIGAEGQSLQSSLLASDDGLLPMAAGGESFSDVYDTASSTLPDASPEAVWGRNMSSFSSPDNLDVAGGNGLVSSDQSLLSSPTLTNSASFSNPSPFVRLTGLEKTTKKQRNKHHSSLTSCTDPASIGQSLRLFPLPEQDQSQAHRKPRQGRLPGKESQQSGDAEFRKSDQGRRAQTSGKKIRCSEDGNESTTATSSVESVSKQKKSIKHKNSFSHRFRSSMSFLRKNGKSASSTDYRESSDSSVFWNTRSGTQINSRELAIGISPDHFVSTVTLHESSLDDGAQVLSQLVLPQGAIDYEDMTGEEILEKLADIAEADPLRAPLRQTLLATTIPRAEHRLDLRCMALCLNSRDPIVCKRAGQGLESMFFNERLPRVPPSDILEILKLTWSSIDSSRHGNEDVTCRHSTLLLLGACAILCHSDRTSAERVQEDVDRFVYQKLHAFIKGGDPDKSSKEYRLLKGTQAFFHDFPAAVKSRVTYHEVDWEHALLSSGVSGKKGRERKLLKANFAQLILVIYSLANEMIRRTWDALLDRLVEETHRARKAIGKRHMDDERRATFDMFLVRCLNLVINTCFREDREEVGDRACKSAEKIASLVSTIVRSASSKHQAMLLDEIRCLPFHPSQQVRKEMKELLKLFSLPLSELCLAYVETRLQVADLKPQRVAPEENNSLELKQRECTWHESIWRGSQPIALSKLQGAICLPTYKCLASGPAEGCVDHTVPRQRSQQHVKHLDTLIELGPHPNLLRLLAFQLRPRPCFYITENVTERRLISLLIDRGTHQRWLSHTVLLQAAQHVVEPLSFLKEKGIALRDVTTFNMIYELKEDKHGRVTDILVKLADLGLCDVYLCCSADRYENRDIRTQRDPGPIPVRWTSWEALFEGRFSDRSMVYAFGYVLYELFTHGCQPFTEMSCRTTDDILQLFFRQSQSVRVFHWPCLPQAVYKLIRWCTEYKALERPSIEQLTQEVRTLLQEQNTYAEREVLNTNGVQSKKDGYPPISLEQKERRHKPEVIPMIVQQLLTGDPDQYKNLRSSSWQTSPYVLATDAELLAQDPCIIRVTGQGGPTVVSEQLTQEFVRNVLPDVESGRNSLAGVADWIGEPVFSIDYNVHVRQYERSTTLLEGVIRTEVPSAYSDDATQVIVYVCLLVARVVSLLHSQNWLHCDLRASNVLVTCDSCKVTLARIGRMVKLPPGMTSVFCPTVHQDSTRWLAPEVLQMRINSKESDVFMLGTLFWEIFNARDKCHKDPTTEGNPSRLVPFADVRISDIASMVQEGVLLPPIAGCPRWLYQLICSCRNPDCVARPTIGDVVNCLEQHCSLSDDRLLKAHWRARFQATSGYVLSDGGDPPTPPPRFTLMQSFTNTLTCTGNFRSAKAKKRKPEIGLPRIGIIFGARVVKDKPQKQMIGNLFRRKPKENNKSEFYELGYCNAETNSADRKPDSIDYYEDQSPEMSGVYADIYSEDVCSDWEEVARPKSLVLPPRKEHPLPAPPIAKRDEHSAPALERLQRQAILPTAGASVSLPKPETLLPVECIYNDTSDLQFPPGRASPTNPAQRDARASPTNPAQRDARAEPEMMFFNVGHALLSQSPRVVLPEEDANTFLRTERNGGTNSPDLPSLAEGTDQDQAQPARISGMKVVRTPQGKLRRKARSSPKHVTPFLTSEGIREFVGKMDEINEDIDNKAEAIYNDNDTPEEVYEHCTEAANQAQAVYKPFDPVDSDDIYDDCTEGIWAQRLQW